MKAWLKLGDEQWVLIHVEVEATESPNIGWRRFICHHRLFDKYNK